MRLPTAEPGYVWARLRGGPLDGDVILAPLDERWGNLPAQLIGVLAPVLDEAAETPAWEAVSYICQPGQARRPRPETWTYIYAPPPSPGA